MRDDLTDEIIGEIVKPEVFPIFIAKLETSAGDVKVWTGIGELEFNDETYLGIGDLGKVSPIKESGDEIRANSVGFQLSGIPSELLSIAIGAKYQGRPASLWLGFMNGTNLIANPILLFKGKMDRMPISEGPETSIITVTAESRLADLKRAKTRRYTHEDQQIDYPEDMFFEYIASVQNVEIVWRMQ